jgi:hypothetical protein
VTEVATHPVPAPAARDVERHLADHAAEYFPDLGGGAARVTLRKEDARVHSTLYEFDVVGPLGRHEVVVKLPPGELRPAGPAAADRIADRPRRAAPPDPRRKPELEFNALTLIHHTFAQLADPRFGTVAPLALLRRHRALVMLKVPEPRLSAVLLRGRLGRAAPDLAATALRNAGAWLATYHRLDAPPHTATRHATRAEFAAYVCDLADYLARDPRNRGFVERVRDRVVAAAGDVLPEQLPLGLGHGDFAPRNVLVGAGGRVTVIDTLARWRAPVYDDLGDFLFALRAPKAQVYALGHLLPPGVRAAREAEFLGGYFGAAEVPVRALRLFEAQAALERLASLQRAATVSAPGPAERLGAGLTHRFLRSALDALMEALDHPTPVKGVL